MNDVAERGIKLMEEFKDISTDNEERRKMLLRCIEDSQRRYLISENQVWLRNTKP